MSTFTFNPTTTTQSLDWNDEAIWLGGVVPDGADADVVFPIVYFNEQAYPYNISIEADEDINVRSIALDDNLIVSGGLNVSENLRVDGYLVVSGTLNVSESLIGDGEIDLTGGTLTAGALANSGLDLQGYGVVRTSGLFTNNSEVVGDGLTLDLAALTNAGSLIAAAGGLTVNVAPGGFGNLDGGTLVGGTYEALFGALDISAGALVTDIAADVKLGYADAFSYDPETAQFVSFLSSVDEIAAAGVLTLSGASFAWGPLADHGLIDLEGGTLASAELQVVASGRVSGYGAISSPIDNDGVITSGFIPATVGDDVMSATLKLAGAVTGAGSLAISAGLAAVYILDSEYQPPSYLSTLELGAAASENVVFANDVGLLKLDDPGAFTGAIATSGWGDQIMLAGVPLASIAATSYRDNGAGGGTLTLSTASGAIALNFIGEFTTANFALTAIPSALSTVPASVEITLTAVTAKDYIDAAANLEALDPAQIAALAGQGVTELSASDASVSYAAAASAEIAALGLELTAPANDFAHETFADGSAKQFDFGADDVLAQVVTTNSDGSSSDYVYNAPGNYLGVTYQSYELFYSAAGALDEVLYFGASGVVGDETFTADGGEADYLGGEMVEEKTVAADGGYDIRYFGVTGAVDGVAFASYDVAYSSAGARQEITWLDASDDVVATRVFSGGGAFTLDVVGLLSKQKIVEADGNFQIVVADALGYPAHRNDFAASGAELAHSHDASAEVGGLNIFGSELEFSSTGAGGPAGGADDFPFTPHASETYTFFAGAANDRIDFAQGFGAAKIKGFAAGNGDVLDLAGLFGGFSAAMDATTMIGRDTVITDAHGDRLTLVDVAASSLTAARLGFA